MKLKKGDKVVMHTCGEAEHHHGKVWTCKTDEYVTNEGNVYEQRLVFLEGFTSSFLTKYLQYIDLPQAIDSTAHAQADTDPLPFEPSKDELEG